MLRWEGASTVGAIPCVHLGSVPTFRCILGRTCPRLVAISTGVPNTVMRGGVSLQTRTSLVVMR